MGSVAQWLACRTDDRGGGAWFRIPLAVRRNFGGSFVQSTVPMSFGGDTKSRRSFLSEVSAWGCTRHHTGGDV